MEWRDMGVVNSDYSYHSWVVLLVAAQIHKQEIIVRYGKECFEFSDGCGKHRRDVYSSSVAAMYINLSRRSGHGLPSNSMEGRSGNVFGSCCAAVCLIY